MAYNNFLQKILQRVESKFSEISANYNFDLGLELEIALCEVLVSLLPERYGVCRGFIVTQDDEIEGDDIIIFDKHSFPSFRLLESKSFLRKQEIPFEAVYAYIEVKNTLYLFGNNGQSITKALNQIGKIKKLSRPAVPVNSIKVGNKTVNFNDFKKNETWPQISNPLFTIIFSRNIKLPKGVEENEIEITNHIKNSKPDFDVVPDLFVLGDSYIGLPGILKENLHYIDSPFDCEKAKLIIKYAPKISFGLAMINLLRALDFIRLGRINWMKIYSDKFGWSKDN